MARKATAPKTAAPKAPKHAGFRVYKFAASLRSAISAKRVQTESTNAAVVAAAVDSKLPEILGVLATIGITGRVGEARKAMRLKVGQSTLDALKVASKQVGLPATLLLTASLSLLCSDIAPKAKRGRKSAK